MCGNKVPHVFSDTIKILKQQLFVFYTSKTFGFKEYEFQDILNVLQGIKVLRKNK
jgi:hypothetical protein